MTRGCRVSLAVSWIPPDAMKRTDKVEGTFQRTHPVDTIPNPVNALMT